MFYKLAFLTSSLCFGSLQSFADDVPILVRKRTDHAVHAPLEDRNPPSSVDCSIPNGLGGAIRGYTFGSTNGPSSGKCFPMFQVLNGLNTYGNSVSCSTFVIGFQTIGGRLAPICSP